MKQHTFILPVVLSLLMLAFPANSRAEISATAKQTAAHAVVTYESQQVASLRKLVRHNTVAIEGIAATDNPVHQAFKQELAELAKQLGLDYTDHGYMVVIGLGDSKQRVGMITHGDVQPVNPAKWKQSPFDLDVTSEPGRLIGRGTEDDKAPIVNALYAMKSIKDQSIKLKKRIELYVYMAEESDWGPIREYVKNNQLPSINITLDAEYPVVTAEKGYGTISMVFAEKKIETNQTYISAFTGGFFGSQIPEDAKVVIENADDKLLKELKTEANKWPQVKFSFEHAEGRLTIQALGRSAHSSTPEDGVNAITHLASLLKNRVWPNNQSGAMVNLINELLGTDLYGKQFGKVAYTDSFMGPMSVQPTVIKKSDNGVKLSINIRRPKGKENAQLKMEFEQALTQWQSKNKFSLQQIDLQIGDPFVQTEAPQIDILLEVFSHYTKIKNPQPISIGGGTNSRLFPTAVSFGPAMPGKEYTGHSEHEFITAEQFLLNLKMYTAVLVELTKE